jgi:PPM family protein phosphatase
MRLAAIGTSDVGRKRTHNEDAFLVMPEAGLFCVADGLGGHASGEVASRMAVEEMARIFAEDVPGPEAPRLAAAMREAGRRIHERAARDLRFAGMGTTLVAAWFPERGPLLVGHAGDSRAYRFRDGEIVRLTEDHSLLSNYIRTAHPSAADIDAFPHKNVVVRALGVRESVEVDVAPVEVRAGDLVLLCCDGLHGMVPDARIAEILRAEGEEILRANQAMVDEALAAGGGDNVTSVLVRVVET